VLGLGPFLHIYGKDVYSVGDTTFSIPLPYLGLYCIPILKGARAANRFDVMLMLSLAILVGYGLRFLLQRFDSQEWGSQASAVLLGLVAAAILGEFVSVPLPILDARLPGVYAAIGQDTTWTGSV
jgi:hypothetical protein